MTIIKTCTNARESVERKELSYTVDGNVNWCIHYRKEYGGFSKKLKIELLYNPATPLLGIYLGEKNHNSKRYLHLNVRSNTIYNSQDIEAMYMSTDRWTAKEDAVHI